MGQPIFGSTRHADVTCLRALLALRSVELDFIAFLQCLKSRRFDGTEVYEQIPAAIVGTEV